MGTIKTEERESEKKTEERESEKSRNGNVDGAEEEDHKKECEREVRAPDFLPASLSSFFSPCSPFETER